MLLEVQSEVSTVSDDLGRIPNGFLAPLKGTSGRGHICRDIPNESEQLNPFTKGPSRSLCHLLVLVHCVF